MSPAEIIAREVGLRAQLADTIQTLSNARRAETWEIVNELIELGRIEGPRP